MAYEIIEWSIAVLVLVFIGLSKNKRLDFLKLPIELICFVFVVLALLIEFWIDPFYDVSFFLFALVPVVSFFCFRDTIRATLVFATNVFLHESIWFLEGGFKYWDNFTTFQLLNYIVLPFVLIPIYLYYTKMNYWNIVQTLILCSIFMLFWNLDGLPDTIYTPVFHLQAELFDMGSWILISLRFIYCEISQKRSFSVSNAVVK